ncbi:hypothetical protein WN944_007483 [Citrus x changshan-huyou]|uniref:Uncharacterized protein n=1 Tax=Citrus x changshan-huyou TaxID=2935761 RepID=A0AAP0ML27_9ROSI
MIASRKGRGRVSKGGGYTKNSNRFRDGKSEGGSRFEVLENEETEEREIILPRQHNVPTTENEQPQSLSHIVGASMEDLARCLGIGERKDKRLYDTFHKRFKDVVSSHPPIPETPCQKDVKPSSVNEVTEVEKDSEGINKRRKKEPELTVKSALSAAFAKYADKMGKKKNSSPQVGETSASSSGAENSDSGKQDS